MFVTSFAAALIAVLSLGIGANTAIFNIVNVVLVRPLPFEDSDRLVRVFHVPPQSTFPGITRFSVSPANFYDWQRQARSFEGMSLYRLREFAVTGVGAVGATLALVAVVARLLPAYRASRVDPLTVLRS